MSGWIYCTFVYVNFFFNFRMESLALTSYSTQAKIMGTLVSISGALVVVLYKGPTILSTPSDPNPSPMFGTPPTNWVIGGLLCALQYLLNSTWYILQVYTYICTTGGLLCDLVLTAS